MLGDDGDEGVLRQLLAGQAQTDSRFQELFRRMDKAEKTSGEARDKVTELVTIIREQDALVRIAEVRAETKKGIDDLRADVVHANTTLTGRVVALEKVREGGLVLARGGKVVLEIAKFAIAAGGGALILKLMGH